MYSVFVIFFAISLLLLPVWILLLIFRNSSKSSNWKYPPTKRIIQFLFSLGNFSFSALIVFPFVMFLFISISSGWGLVIGLSIIALGIVSLLSLFRPAFTKGILLIYVIIGVSSYYASPTRELPTTYHDACNELREDPYCEEGDKVFNCKPPSKHVGKLLDKSICENSTLGNSDYDFEDSFSKYEGETYITKIPLLYIKNLPRNNCKHRRCGYKVDTELEDFRNPCSNCLDKKRLTTRLNIELVPVGTKFKVIDAFKLKRKFVSLSSSDHLVLVVQDEKGQKAETSEIGFKLNVVNGRRNWEKSLEEIVLHDLNKIEQESVVAREFCFMSKVGSGSFIESRLKNFLKDFHIEKEIHYIPFVEKVGTKRTSTTHCTEISFNSKNSYLLGHYYFKEWGLW